MLNQFMNRNLNCDYFTYHESLDNKTFISEKITFIKNIHIHAKSSFYSSSIPEYSKLLFPIWKDNKTKKQISSWNIIIAIQNEEQS